MAKRKFSIKKIDIYLDEVLADIAKYKMFTAMPLSRNTHFTLASCQDNLKCILLEIISKLRWICRGDATPSYIWDILVFYEYTYYKQFNILDISKKDIAKSIDISPKYLNSKFRDFNDIYEWYMQLRSAVYTTTQYTQNILKNNLCHETLRKTMSLIAHKMPFEINNLMIFNNYEFNLNVKEQYTAKIETDFCYFYDMPAYVLMDCIFYAACKIIRGYSAIAINNNTIYCVDGIKKLHYDLWENDFETYLSDNGHDVEKIILESKNIDLQKLVGTNPFYFYNSMIFNGTFSDNSSKYHFTTNLKGINYENADGKNRKRILLEVPDRMNVSLAREHDNLHDPNAVAVYTSNLKLGYVSKDIAQELSKHLDKGLLYSASLFINRFDTRTGEFIKDGTSTPCEYTSITTKLNITIAEGIMPEARIIW